MMETIGFGEDFLIQLGNPSFRSIPNYTVYNKVGQEMVPCVAVVVVELVK